MPKGVANQRYTGEFKQKIVETMLQDKLGYVETAEYLDYAISEYRTGSESI